jgi:broad specificity phosphatase PhoE
MRRAPLRTRGYAGAVPPLDEPAPADLPARAASPRPGPAELVLVRHGESVGNLADRDARRRGAGRLTLDARDADVQLSDLGAEQAAAVGRHLAELAQDARPTVLLSSPYRRAADTARAAADGAGLHLRIAMDERLRERDLGAFDGMTGTGIREEFPEEARRRQHTGKLYYRPPGGESWCDVALRVRSVLDTVRLDHDGARLWVFTHQAVIMAFRFVLEQLTEDELLAIDRDTPIANCSITTYRHGGDGVLELVSFADTTAVDRATAAVTHEDEQAGRSGDVAS